MKNSRILIDLSEFNDWSGHLTGVQRVVLNIGKYLAQHTDSKQDVVYFTYDENSDSLIKVDINSFEVDKSVSESSAATVFVPREVARKLYKRTPYFIRSRLSPSHKEAAKRVANRSLGLVRRIRHGGEGLIRKGVLRSTSEGTDFDFVKPRQGDTILSAGRIWDHPKQQLLFSKLRKEKDVRVAYVIYDLIPIFQQHTFGPGLTEKYTEYLYELLNNSDLLLPISRSSEKDLLRFAQEMGFDHVPKSVVIRLGDDIPRTVGNTNKPQGLPSEVVAGQFALCVGTIEARKNHQLLYNTYKLAAQRGVVLPHLVIVGRPGWLTGDIIYFLENDLDIKDSVTILKNCDDQTLSWLYENGMMSLYPSQYEGWGLPVAESLAYGLPCISANVSSMTEIASEKLVSFVSPFDSAQLLESIIQLSSTSENQKRAKHIRAAYKPYSWSETAKTISKLF